jgi:hypothetical protein
MHLIHAAVDHGALLPLVGLGGPALIWYAVKHEQRAARRRDR